MKKGIITGFVVCLVLLLAVGASPKHWQDILIRPNQEWVENYNSPSSGASEVAQGLIDALTSLEVQDSQLAYNNALTRQLIDGQGKVIAALKKELDVLKEKVAAIDIKQRLDALAVRVEALEPTMKPIVVPDKYRSKGKWEKGKVVDPNGVKYKMGGPNSDKE
ncbi:hypothetical protein LCGC14_1592760 [marine sediment metagenome]|uniref:Uncharacterized protein n=1 Tax=marine sediment metagenome TaxID=412755 RepID=A0A0F9KU72_9ZZZZ